MSDLPPVLVVKKSGRKGSCPSREDTLHKSLLLALFLAIIRENGFVTGQESAHENQIAVLVHADAHNFQSLGGVLLRQLVQQRVFIAARLAPGGPEIDEDWLTFKLPQDHLVARYVDEFRISRCRGLRVHETCQKKRNPKA